MQEKHLFEYAIIRVVPRVEREEFLNVGVILYCPDKKFLETKFALDKEKLLLFCPEIDVDDLDQRINGFAKVCKGLPDESPFAGLTQAGRFRWLTAARSTIVQTSAVHPGLCEDPLVTLNSIFSELVA